MATNPKKRQLDEASPSEKAEGDLFFKKENSQKNYPPMVPFVGPCVFILCGSKILSFFWVLIFFATASHGLCMVSSQVPRRDESADAWLAGNTLVCLLQVFFLFWALLNVGCLGRLLVCFHVFDAFRTNPRNRWRVS